ncbi:MAG: polysaccharide deacetylase family protein [Acidobacteriales bacterium]|nr:polysaccharide deacetylase family protein [Terriglobales bacterium]
MAPRIDRLITLCLVQPFLRLLSQRAASIPILMYHSVSEQDESATGAYYRTSTTPDRFAAQMQWLKDQGYRSCSPAQATQYLRENMSGAGKQVVITFDDGYRDFYSHAFPVLQQYGFSAIVYLPTAFIGNTSIQFKGKDCLTWAEVRELRSYGMWFGSHTVNHPQLHDLGRAVIREEIRNSKQEIEEKLGCPVKSFAYPYAFPQTDVAFSRWLREALVAGGYSDGVCTMVGRAKRESDPLFLERLPINSCDDHDFFTAKLNGAYDWIAKPQYLAKLVKSRRFKPSGKG